MRAEAPRRGSGYMTQLKLNGQAWGLEILGTQSRCKGTRPLCRLFWPPADAMGISHGVL